MAALIVLFTSLLVYRAAGALGVGWLSAVIENGSELSGWVSYSF